MGGISQLPEDIILKILPLLKTAEQPVVSIFSKTWYNAWITYPILIFDSGKEPENRKKFLNFIDGTLVRCRKKNIHIEELKISDLYIESWCPVPPVRDWISIAVQNGVKSLDITFGSNWEKFNMYHSIFEGNLLRELKLKVKYGGVVKMIKQFGDDKVMFNHLKILYLERINIDDAMFEGMIASCPLIEELFVKNCVGLKRIKVTDLYNLNKLKLYSYELLDVEIEAHNLQSLDCYIPNGSLKFCKTDMLKSLELWGLRNLLSPSLDKWEHKFPQVEVLTLSDVEGNLSSPSVKHICLSSSDFMKVNINAPNLKSLKLHDILDLSLENDPNMVIDLLLTNALKISVSFYNDVIGIDDLRRLNQLLTKAINSKISLGFGPAVAVEDIQLRFCYSTELVQSNFVEALFLICHPKIIIITENCDLVDYFSKKLIERRRELKEVQLEILDERKNQWKLVSDWTSLSEKRKECASLRFMLQWKT